MRRLRALLLLVGLAACGEATGTPELEAAGEPGTPIFRAAGAFAPFGPGSATYVLDDRGVAALSFSPDFAIPVVPGVSVFLSQTPDLAGAVKVGALREAAGAQRWTFAVPRGAVWSWVLLWSEEVGVVVGRARLDPL